MAGYSLASRAIGVLFSDCNTKDTPPPFAPPNTTFGYTPVGEQHRNQKQNIQTHQELISEAEGITAFDVNAYDPDHGLDAMSKRIAEDDVRDTKIMQRRFCKFRLKGGVPGYLSLLD